MSELKFYRCKHCGNIVVFANNSGVPVMCCGEPMTAIEANTTDAAVEKHVPDVQVSGDMVTVKVGVAPHPMLENHYILWIVLETKQGYQMKTLKPGEAAEAVFSVCGDDEPVAAYAYCNLHGLWKMNI